MDKKKILFCTEASFLPTGYGVYSREVLSRLYENPNFEVAELSCYTDSSNLEFKNIPWLAYANKPLPDSPEMKEYRSNPSNEYGEFTFNTVCLQFQPDFVVDIRDPWVFEYQVRSPFRRFFHHVLMPTVDAAPQHPDWLDLFSQADGVFTYSEFGMEVLNNQSDKIKISAVASPCVSPDFHILEDQDKNRRELGIPEDLHVVGTVMRNQRRKLYPELFQAFKKLLQETERNNLYLYCHTNFPDVGWSMPELLMEFGLSTKVLFTYKCTTCNNISATFFKDAKSQCENCGNFTNNLAGLGNPLNNKELNKVYNSMDIYIQYANSEGFGMPQLEAAKSGTVVLSVDYSAMSSVIKNINAIPITVNNFYKECETGCYRANPNEKSLLDSLKVLIEKSRLELAEMGERFSFNVQLSYDWDKTCEKWADYFTKTPTLERGSSWLSPIEILEPMPLNARLESPRDRVDFLIAGVLRRPDLIGGYLWRRLLRDLTYGNRLENAGGEFYFNEHHIKDQVRSIEFDYEKAYKEMLDLREYYNIWETHRSKFITNNNSR